MSFLWRLQRYNTLKVHVRFRDIYCFTITEICISIDYNWVRGIFGNVHNTVTSDFLRRKENVAFSAIHRKFRLNVQLSGAEGIRAISLSPLLRWEVHGKGVVVQNGYRCPPPISSATNGYSRYLSRRRGVLLGPRVSYESPSANLSVAL